jgi:hypothetical protein
MQAKRFFLSLFFFGHVCKYAMQCFYLNNKYAVNGTTNAYATDLYGVIFSYYPFVSFSFYIGPYKLTVTAYKREKYGSFFSPFFLRGRVGVGGCLFFLSPLRIECLSSHMPMQEHDGGVLAANSSVSVATRPTYK